MLLISIPMILITQILHIVKFVGMNMKYGVMNLYSCLLLARKEDISIYGLNIAHEVHMMSNDQYAYWLLLWYSLFKELIGIFFQSLIARGPSFFFS